MYNKFYSSMVARESLPFYLQSGIIYHVELESLEDGSQEAIEVNATQLLHEPVVPAGYKVTDVYYYSRCEAHAGDPAAR